MHEILRALPTGSFVLDLGCDAGSFPSSATAATVIRLDLERPNDACNFVQADASQLPFASQSFAGVICNHSLEHFTDLPAVLREIGRVIRSDGALFISVPDASTFTDKLYRWLARGGGHVNAFTAPDPVVDAVESATGLRHVATRLLYSSLSFLNRRNSPRPIPKRLLLLGGGHEFSLFIYAWLSRRVDRIFGSRTSIYGWAFYFGSIAARIETEAWPNVCIRCGSAVPAHQLSAPRWRCPNCGAVNPFFGPANR